jgi:hypothetical protein
VDAQVEPRPSAIDSTGFCRKTAVVAIIEASLMIESAECMARLFEAGWPTEALPQLQELADQLHDFLDFIELAIPRVAAADPRAEVGLELLRVRLHRDVDQIQRCLENKDFALLSSVLEHKLIRHLRDYQALGGHVALALRQPAPAA